MRASRVSAAYGAKVGIAESHLFGGTCVNVGCIPKKLFSYAAHWREEFEVARAYGWSTTEPQFEWPTLLANKDKEIARLNAVYERLLTATGVEIIRGRATVVDPHTVEINGRRHSAKHILIATGSWPVIPVKTLPFRRTEYQSPLSEAAISSQRTAPSQSGAAAMADRFAAVVTVSP